MTTRPPARPGRPRFAHDPLTGTLAEVRVIQPYAATKTYRCPGCNQEIARGVAHVVVVPLSSAEDRRHWHIACFDKRSTRRPGK